MQSFLDDAAFIVEQVEFQSAELCAGSSVGTSSEAVFRRIAYSGIADAQGTMYESFQFRFGSRLVYLADFVERCLAGKNDSLETESREPFHFVGGSVVGLCACVQGNAFGQG